MSRLLIHPNARVDLLEIWHFKAEDSIEAANRVSRRLEAEIRELLAMPGKGRFRPDVLDVEYRFWTVYSWVIAYEYDDETLTVIRVVHGHRNFQASIPASLNFSPSA
jgi:plasmid stabilization system protein ParE